RLRLIKASIDAIRWLTFQACAFRGHDESLHSRHQGNFLEMLKLLASYNEQVNEVVVTNVPKNAKYTSPKIQKEILHVMPTKVRSVIHDKIDDAKFCLIVGEARDESKRGQMAIVLRLLIKKVLYERFFVLMHVRDTSASILHKEIFDVLSRNNLSIKNIRGQGYDSASNMRGEWNGLALILNDCPPAYYVHCLVHRLRLALVAASREIILIHQFFSNLTFIVNIIVNIITASCKRSDELQAAQASKIMRNIDMLSQILQQKSQNIVNAMQLVASTKSLIQDLRDDGWENLLDVV
ncbi:LOW QUALITY PROTEIN: DUF4371 domain-containing protein, partial [Cephalotus follicularis]